ncbi:MAG: VCBS repeat-containing protein [Verrucomicrobia bacterium]|nr:VCBS repeat-containing protein [Verrucomicrobiota bacterium]MCH8510173.1 VCBS repeat-containing protein [Kiritimatiellia bacterium]
MKKISFLFHAMLWVAVSSAHAYINPDYTPVNLFRDAETVLVLAELKIIEEDGTPMLRGTVAKAIKGEGEGTRMFSGAALEEFAWREVVGFVERYAGNGAMLVSGDFSGGNVDSSEEDPAFFLHLGNNWYALDALEDDGSYELGEPDADMLAIWNGATHMLARVAAYVLSVENPVVPAEGETEWGEAEVQGEIEGDVHGISVVDPGDTGKPAAWIHAAEGDQWFENGTLSAMGFSSQFGVGMGASLIAYTGEGIVRVDVSRVSDENPETSFEDPLALDLELEGGPVGLHGMVRNGTPALLVAGKRQVLWFSDAPERHVLDHEFEEDAPGAIASALADFTGNGIADFVWIFPEHALLFAGNPEGGFEAAKRVATYQNMGEGAIRVRTGDLDGDGRLDLVIAGNNGTRMLVNHGETFQDIFALSGEISYIAGPGVRDILFADFTHHGRMDLVFVYDNRGALFFFNRGFASYGFAIDMDLMEAWPDSADGSVAGASGNFRGEGVQDLLLLSTGGELVLIPGGEAEHDGLGAHLPAGAANAPATIFRNTAEPNRSAQSVTPGGAPASFGGADVKADDIKSPQGGKTFPLSGNE